ncbi:unnamed protein product [Lepeophtheirus salmonis]|uniref:(salmon louse) hypothetical protein n=1 Tax=Lepeophtheirus salmonis TaxID=72036 RepID=A0A7R8H7L5_LEPSM|nr:unnamed protein product [Lepeophtheirus salmonis]CAF2912865.1 unnamed protein product [Lepeophtheirus salmonis]
MLKHCQATANERSSTRSSRRLLNTTNQSNISLSSSSSGESSLLSKFDSRRSSYSSPESFSRSSSFLSLNNSDPRTPIRVFAKCLRPDIEYKTIGISYHTTSVEVVKILLSKFKMKHRDPKLFYLSMDIYIGGDEPRRTLILEDDARPAELKSCHPWGPDCRFILQSRKGALVRVWDSAVMRDSKYKSLLISEKTNVNEILKILFRCYGNPDKNLDDFCLVERCDARNYERALHPQDCPALVQSLWPNPSTLRFVLKQAKDPQLPNTILEEEEDMDVSYSTSSSSSSPVTPKYCRPYPVKRATICKPPRSLSVPPQSVEESVVVNGPPPPLAPKPFRSSFGSSSSVGSQTSFHDYENYFYI